MNAFAKFFGGALLRSFVAFVWMAAFAYGASAQTSVFIDSTLGPLCHTDAQLIRVAELRSSYQNWGGAVDAVNHLHSRAVCALVPFRYRRELMLATVQVGNEFYEMWQVKLTALWIEGQWRQLEEPHTEYTLIPVHELASNPHKSPRPPKVAGDFFYMVGEGDLHPISILL